MSTETLQQLRGLADAQGPSRKQIQPERLYFHIPRLDTFRAALGRERSLSRSSLERSHLGGRQEAILRRQSGTQADFRHFVGHTSSQ